MAHNNTVKFDAALRLIIEIQKPNLLEAIVQGRTGLYNALKQAGYYWNQKEQCWTDRPRRKSKYINEAGKSTGYFNVRITAPKDLMHTVSDRVERGLRRRGCRIINSSNWIESKKQPVVYVFIQAEWPDEEEDEE